MKAISTITNQQIEELLERLNREKEARMHGATGGIIPQEPTEALYNIERMAALEQLAEVAGMYCERLPDEVREALHKVPGIGRQHGHSKSSNSTAPLIERVAEKIFDCMHPAAEVFNLPWTAMAENWKDVYRQLAEQLIPIVQKESHESHTND